MALISWWFILVWLDVLVLVVTVLIIAPPRRQATRHILPVAHGGRLSGLKRYRTLLGRYKAYVRFINILLAAMILLGVILTLRPAKVDLESREAKRDIMLCLDVSGPLRQTDADFLRTFETRSHSFDGERIGVTVYDSTPSSAFALTDDYGYARAQLRQIADQILQEGSSIYVGTHEASGSAHIGDGLAGCVARFDQSGTARARSIILLSGNLGGAGTTTFGQAATLANQKNIHVYGINPADPSPASNPSRVAQQFYSVIKQTGGQYYKLTPAELADPTSLSEVTNHILDMESTRIKGTPKQTAIDEPNWAITALIIIVILYVLVMWRLGR